MNKLKNENGQALLFVIIVLTVAMAIGMAASSRTVSSVRRSTNTDTSSRVYTVAEGGIELFLKQPQDVLFNLADSNNQGGNDCPSGTVDFADDDKSCVINYSTASGDFIETRAIVNVEPFTFNNPQNAPQHYWFNINSGEVKEVRLDNSFTGNIQVCWNSQDSSVNSDIYFMYYNDTTGPLAKGILQNKEGSNSSKETTIPASLLIAANASTYTQLDFTDCAQIEIPNNAVTGLRLKSLYAPSKVGIFNLSSSSLPNQGFIIHSTGEIIDNQTVKTVKKLKVYRSYQYLPSMFDYAVYSNSPLGITP